MSVDELEDLYDSCKRFLPVLERLDRLDEPAPVAKLRRAATAIIPDVVYLLKAVEHQAKVNEDGTTLTLLLALRRLKVTLEGLD